MIKTILPAIHTSPETGYLVEDYPYGFRLRCKIRYWLETNKKGTRFCSQTSNPKAAGLVWNKPKASTYSEFSGAMYLNEDGHVTWQGIGQYTGLPEMKKFLETFSENATNIKQLKTIVRYKEIFEEEMDKFTPRIRNGAVQASLPRGKAPHEYRSRLIRI